MNSAPVSMPVMNDACACLLALEPPQRAHVCTPSNTQQESLKTRKISKKLKSYFTKDPQVKMEKKKIKELESSDIEKSKSLYS